MSFGGSSVLQLGLLRVLRIERMMGQTKRFCDFGPFGADRQKRLLLQGV